MVETMKELLDYWFGDLDHTPVYFKQRNRLWFAGGAKVDADITTVPANAAKGALTLVVLGQTITSVDFVDLTSDLYLALTPNDWQQYGTSADYFDFLPAGLLDPATGIAKLLHDVFRRRREAGERQGSADQPGRRHCRDGLRREPAPLPDPG